MCADVTLTLAAAKPGLLLEDARRHVGSLYVADIGVPGEVIRRVTGAPGPTFGPGDILALGRSGRVEATTVGVSG